MVKKIKTNGNPTTLEIRVESRREVTLALIVSDAEQKNTLYTKRTGVVNGVVSFFVRMPQSPRVAKVVVFNQARGLMKRDNSYKIVSIKQVPLRTINLPMSKQTKSFVKFAQEFSQEAGVLSATKGGDTYKSNNGKFRIDYFDIIRSKMSGYPLSTPARISQINGKIEVGKSKFQKYTIPMRMAILMHEYSHFYLNRSPSDESEADLNGLRVYLSLGYPRIDAYNVFLKVFKKAPNQQNRERYENLDNFIKEFRTKFEKGNYEQ
mgnify:FL=1|jgi:hypothetical protein|tara:strand:- start:28228 stop:29019 length:792 start_codon:yes stop_codon:yes gene_type:complete